MVTKRRRSRNFPSPEYCILDMVNAHLKMNREGRKLTRGVLVGGGRKGLRYCGIGLFLVRCCGNFYFKVRYCGFQSPSGVR